MVKIGAIMLYGTALVQVSDRKEHKNFGTIVQITWLANRGKKEWVKATQVHPVN